MRISRKTTNSIKFITDQLIPPLIRDSRVFGYIFLRIIFGNNYKLFLSFKEIAGKANASEIENIYKKVYMTNIAIDRETDLGRGCVSHILSIVSGRKVLEVGCGKGFLAGKLKEADGRRHVSACDIALDEKLEQKYQGITFRNAQMESLPYKDREFDVVITTHTLEHAYDIHKAISELRRVCRRQLIIVVPKERPYLYTPNLHLHFFPSADYLINFLRGKNAKCVTMDGDLVYTEKMYP